MNWTQFTPGWQRHQCLLLILTTCNKDIFLSFSNTKKAIELKCNNYCSPGFGDPDAALKLHQAHLNIARQMHDKAGMGRAYGNIGNAYR